MSAAQYLTQQTGIGQLEASDLISLAERVAAAFVNLKRYYSYDNVEATRRHIDNVRKHASKDRLGRVLSGAPMAPFGAENMWKCYREASECVRRFNMANGTHSTGLDGNQMLTRCFEALHQSRNLRSAQDVPEGRRAYESLISSANLAVQAGW